MLAIVTAISSCKIMVTSYGWVTLPVHRISNLCVQSISKQVGWGVYRAVITAAQGYFVEYDRSITHHSFNLQDVKAQNIMQYFDEATRKIGAGKQPKT
jgi:hypothetical protein